MPTKLVSADKLPIFATVVLGVYKSAEAYRRAFNEAPWPADRPDTLTNRALDEISFAQQETEVDLVGLTPKAMGFEFRYRAETVKHEQLWLRGAEIGLQLCPHEAAYATLLKWNDEIERKIPDRRMFFASKYVQGCLLSSSYYHGMQRLDLSMNHHQYGDDLIIFVRSQRIIKNKRDYLLVTT